ncbi:YqjF family protein [Streptomyces sp. 4N509B]|uniref:YqjF family protein n=1 Tax=Streptomyces sp. 4N509B TaxID=3457413 RepID=UPI003FD571B4
MVSESPEEDPRLPVLRAQWTTLTFVHWPFGIDEVRRTLPEGLAVDAFEGRAWVSLTPFVMAHVRPLGLPPGLPGLLTFAETNLRTYVRGPGGRDGLWFLDIEAGSPTTLAARATVGAPYHWADLAVTLHDAGDAGRTVRYSGARRGRGGPSYALTVRPGERLRPSERDVWLTGRWRAYTRHLGVLWEVPVCHEPWPLRTATLDGIDETLLEAVGLPAPAADPVVHYAEAVREVRIGPPRPHRPR